MKRKGYAPRGLNRNMRILTIYVPWSHIKAVDKIVDAGFFINRSEAIRVFVRNGLSNFSLEEEFCGMIKSSIETDNPDRVLIGGKSYRIIQKN